MDRILRPIASLVLEDFRKTPDSDAKAGDEMCSRAEASVIWLLERDSSRYLRDCWQTTGWVKATERKGEYGRLYIPPAPGLRSTTRAG
jgi:hypothetical protein